MLISEKLHLLLVRSDGKDEPSVWGTRSYAEIAAVVIDLAYAGRVRLSAEKHPRVRIVSPAPTGRPVLDGELTTLAPRDGDRLDSLVGRGALDPRELLGESLIAQGVLARGSKGFLGMGDSARSAPASRMSSRARPLPRRPMRCSCRCCRRSARPMRSCVPRAAGSRLGG